mmetsp:Transcript_21931/g.41826  ORF Transcript_21931/g.41826 Transcript_21931/m.41826 type:complete len:430 (+) Transcript_21931:499-1788(+)
MFGGTYLCRRRSRGGRSYCSSRSTCCWGCRSGLHEHFVRIPSKEQGQEVLSVGVHSEENAGYASLAEPLEILFADECLVGVAVARHHQARREHRGADAVPQQSPAHRQTQGAQHLTAELVGRQGHQLQQLVELWNHLKRSDERASAARCQGVEHGSILSGRNHERTPLVVDGHHAHLLRGFDEEHDGVEQRRLERRECGLAPFLGHHRLLQHRWVQGLLQLGGGGVRLGHADGAHHAVQVDEELPEDGQRDGRVEDGGDGAHMRQLLHWARVGEGERGDGQQHPGGNHLGLPRTHAVQVQRGEGVRRNEAVQRQDLLHLNGGHQGASALANDVHAGAHGGQLGGEGRGHRGVSELHHGDLAGVNVRGEGGGVRGDGVGTQPLVALLHAPLLLRHHLAHGRLGRLERDPGLARCLQPAHLLHVPHLLHLL